RDGMVIAVAVQGDEEVERISNEVIWIPPSLDLFLPMIEVVPLQMLAYQIAVRRGCDVDQPRNLAKSVTVE
ncbi:MAG: glutamine--fructose-6-phosphate aminotransferase, partial [Bryobacteraceae bacterium]